jgi:Zn-dependent protease/CBS domain-containing protein
MGQGIRLGRLFGVTLFVDLGWAFLFALAGWNLNAALRPAHPEWGAGLTRAVAVGGAVLFLGAVLCHELGRALVGRWLGRPAGALRLFLFGDAAWGERAPASASGELLAAAAGAVASAGLGFGALAALLAGAAPSRAEAPAFASLGPAQTLLAWWGFCNLGVAAINLLPAFPLDGGKIVRALLWRLTGDVGRATRAAAALAHVFALWLVAAGAAMALGFRLPAAGVGLVGGLWLASLGWFLHVAAGRAGGGGALGRLLDGVFVGALMRTDVARVPPDAPLGAALERLRAPGAGPALAVVEGDLFVGLLADDDARAAAARERAAAPVSNVMTPLFRLATARAGEPLADALARMAARDVDRLPVFEGGRLVGLLYRDDVAPFFGPRLAPPAPGADDAPASAPRAREAA